MELVIRRARLRGKEGLYDIAVENGKITAILEKVKGEGEVEIDAAGRLTVPAFIDPHIHLDKVLTAETVRVNVSGTLMEAIEILWDAKRKYTVEDVKRRASKVIEWEVMNGVTRIRTHCDIDTIGGLTALKALLELRREYRDIADIQIVAFPQEGIFTDPGADELMRKAMELGADVVGGMPHTEATDDTAKKHVDFLFELAKEYNADIDSHVDETDDPFSRCIEYMAWKTIQEGYKGRVTADHVCALASSNDYHASKVIRWIKAAEMNIETNPETNLVVEGRLDTYPKRRGLTRVKQLLNAGVNVTFGQDCVKDAFYPYGKCDPLQVGFVLALAEQMTSPAEMEKVLDMLTFNAAKTLRVKDYGIEVGKRADIVILDAETVWEALRLQPARLYVIKEGKIIAENRFERKLNR